MLTIVLIMIACSIACVASEYKYSYGSEVLLAAVFGSMLGLIIGLPVSLAIHALSTKTFVQVSEQPLLEFRADRQQSPHLLVAADDALGTQYWYRVSSKNGSGFEQVSVEPNTYNIVEVDSLASGHAPSVTIMRETYANPVIDRWATALSWKKKYVINVPDSSIYLPVPLY